MSDIPLGPPAGPAQRPGLRQRLLSLAASRGFQSWAARFPLTRRATRREGEAMFDLVAGFVHTQCLAALVGLGTLDRLRTGPETPRRLAAAAQVPHDRMAVLLDAGIALGLLRRDGDACRLTIRGAALTGVPGLNEMIAHHAILYRDLADPVAFFRGETETELAGFWPYVFGAGAADDPGAARRYSQLMAETQALVTEETLASVNLGGQRHLMDVGGGTGVFLSAALAAHPGLAGTLFDLPGVIGAARDRLAAAGQSDRVTLSPGSFRDDPLPRGTDAISLVRVLYDHADATVEALLARVHEALPKGGRIIVSEPMTGGERPTRAGDAYFAIYTMAMRTGRTRSPAQVSAMLTRAGFGEVRHLRTRRAFITSVVVGRRV